MTGIIGLICTFRELRLGETQQCNRLGRPTSTVAESFNVVCPAASRRYRG